MTDTPQSDPQAEPVTIVRPDPSGVPPVPRTSRARTTVVGCVYHAREGAEPTAVELGSTRFVEHDEQPYVREMTLADEWTPLDVGWLASKVGVVVVKNVSKDALCSAVVGVWNVDGVVPTLLVRAGDSVRFVPLDESLLYLKSTGPTKVVVHVYPY